MVDRYLRLDRLHSSRPSTPPGGLGANPALKHPRLRHLVIPYLGRYLFALGPQGRVPCSTRYTTSGLPP